MARSYQQGTFWSRRARHLGPCTYRFRSCHRQYYALPLCICNQAQGRRFNRQVQASRLALLPTATLKNMVSTSIASLRPSSKRLLFAIAAARDYNLTSLDIRQAYLQATIDEDLYMRVPPGINSGNNSLVCKLRRSLYGLKQAGREWGLLLTSFPVSYTHLRAHET